MRSHGTLQNINLYKFNVNLSNLLFINNTVRGNLGCIEAQLKLRVREFAEFYVIKFI